MLRMRGRGLSPVRASGGFEISEQFVHVCVPVWEYVCGGVGPAMHVLRND